MCESTPCIVAENASYMYEYPCLGRPTVYTVGLDKVSLTVNTGERVVLLGANGSGKTTLLRAMYGTHKFSGKLTVLGRHAFEDTTLHRDVAYVGERWPSRYGWSNTVKDLVTMFPNTPWDRVLLLCERLHVDLTWRVDLISDGMRRRVQLLMGLLFKKKVLLMDECTPDLDLVERASLLDFLKEQSEQQQVTVVISTHIFDHLSDWPTKIVRLKDGKVLDIVLKKDLSPTITLQQLAYNWIAEDLGLTEQEKNSDTVGTSRKFPESNSPSKTNRPACVKVIDFDFDMGDTKSRWGTGQRVFTNLNLTIPQGCRVLLVGTNGSGKSTLLRVLGGKHYINNEKAFVLDRPCFDDTRLHQVVGFSGSWWDDSPWDMSVLELLGVDNVNQLDDRTKDIITVMRIDVNWRLKAVSLGQRTRIQLLYALRTFKPVLLLDEITAYLDVVQRIDLLRWIWNETETTQCTALYSTHIFEGMDGWASDMVMLDSIKGRVEMQQGLAEVQEPLLLFIGNKLRELKRAEWDLIAARTAKAAEQ